MNQINIKTTNLELTAALKEYVNDKVSNLYRYAANKPVNVDVELEHMPAHHSGPVFRCEIMFDLPGEKKLFRADSVEADMYAAIDTCVPKIKEQLTKDADKRETMMKKGGRKLKEMMNKLWE